MSSYWSFHGLIRGSRARGCLSLPASRMERRLASPDFAWHALCAGQALNEHGGRVLEVKLSNGLCNTRNYLNIQIKLRKESKAWE